MAASLFARPLCLLSVPPVRLTATCPTTRKPPLSPSRTPSCVLLVLPLLPAGSTLSGFAHSEGSLTDDTRALQDLEDIDRDIYRSRELWKVRPSLSSSHLGSSTAPG